MRFSIAFVLAALPLLAAAAPIELAQTLEVRRSYLRPAPATSDTSLRTPALISREHIEASSPKMEDGYSGVKTIADYSDHTVAEKASDERVPTAVSYLVKGAADGTTHEVDGGVVSDDEDKESQKGQAEEMENEERPAKVVVDVGRDEGALPVEEE